VATKTFSKEDKAKYKEEKMAEQRQMMESALAELTSSDAWSNWIKYGRPNLKRLSFTNALLIWSQRKDATVVWGQKQWESKGVKVNADAQKIRYLAPCMGFKYENGQQVFGADGKPVRVVKFFKTVTGYDVQDTDAPASDLDLMVEITGDDYLHLHAPLESFARELGIVVRYREDTGKANGWYDERNSEIVMNKNLSGNELVRTLVHELCHAYGNVNYTDFTRDEAEVLVESATVMTLSILNFDVSKSSVPYIASWGGDLKVLDKYARLVEELVNQLTDKLGF
jgi:hypothetical protein